MQPVFETLSEILASVVSEQACDQPGKSAHVEHRVLHFDLFGYTLTQLVGAALLAMRRDEDNKDQSMWHWYSRGHPSLLILGE